MAADPLDAIFTKEDRAFFTKARYRLTEQHFSEEDKLLEPDTEVGFNSEHKWTRPPTPGMIGLDERSQSLVDKIALAGDGLNPIDKLPIVVDQAILEKSSA